MLIPANTNDVVANTLLLNDWNDMTGRPAI